MFIYQSSFIAIDGRRYFFLGDDALISMRYAWNLSHGNGLVWNVGEYVEGYTNLLMVLIMSLITLVFDKISATLVVQILGVFLIVGIAFLAREIARTLTGEEYHGWHEMLVFSCVLFYYPLIYWSVLGMETGLLTLLLLVSVLAAFKVHKGKKWFYPFGVAFFAGLAYLTRQDSLVPIAFVLAFTFLAVNPLDLKKITVNAKLGWIIVYVLFVAGQTLFRFAYYGEWVPNTYTLKVSGIPIVARLEGGISFITPFFIQTSVPLILAMLSMLRQPTKEKALLFSLFVSMVIYQTWVGGDAWPLWRMMAPVMPYVFILAIWEVLALVRNVYGRGIANGPLPSPLYSGLLTLALIVSVNGPFWKEITFSLPLNLAAKNHVDQAIAVNNLTTPEASVGVIWAGSVPYYTDRRGVDFLGKNDKYIARLEPDLSSSVSFDGIVNVPGHIKYNLYYSIKKMKPTYIEDYRWGRQNLYAKVKSDYVRVYYQDKAGGVIIYLRRNSPAVLWDKVQIEPWP